MTIANDNNIKKRDKIVDEINRVAKVWTSYTKRAELKNDLKERIRANLNTLCRVALSYGFE